MAPDPETIKIKKRNLTVSPQIRREKGWGKSRTNTGSIANVFRGPEHSSLAEALYVLKISCRAPFVGRDCIGSGVKRVEQ